VARVPAGEDWTEIALDLRQFEGEPVHVRLLYVSPAPASAWRVMSVRIGRQ